MRITRASLALSLAAVLGVSTLTALAPTAQAIDAGTGIIGADIASSWQTNGVVYALTYANGVVYVGGSFTSVRPSGDAPGTGEVPASGIAAIDANTGELIPAFAPVLTGTNGAAPIVYSIAVSPDNSRVYLGGQFATVDGQSKPSLAAVSSTDGSLVTSWKGRIPSGIVYALATTPNDDLYIGGQLGVVDGVRRSNVARVDTNGLLSSWAPVAGGGAVREIFPSADGSEVVLAGSFRTMNSDPHQAIIAVDPTTGAAMPAWGSGPFLSQYFQVYHATVSGSTLYVGGVDFGGKYGVKEFDGTAAIDMATGNVLWSDYCAGDTHGVAVIGSVLYAGSHAHDCSTVPGGFPHLGSHQDLYAENTSTGQMLDWYPKTNSSPSPEQNGPRVMATDGTQLFVGGDFTMMSGHPQQGFARFTPTSDASPAPLSVPTAHIADDGTVAVQELATTDADDATLTYSLFRDNGATPVATQTVQSTFWRLPVVQFTDTPPNGRHTYTVQVTDGTATVTSRVSNTVFAGQATTPAWAAALKQSGPTSWWRFDEASGSTGARDYTFRTSGASYHGNWWGGTTGAIANDADPSITLDGSSAYVAMRQPTIDPEYFSAGVWFQTTSWSGGKLLGFGNRNSGTSNHYDRHIYLTNYGQVVAGVYDGSTHVVASPTGYNDGRWHWAVETFDGTTLTLYVDGQSMGTVTSNGAENMTGFWRVGGDDLDSWPGAPSSRYFGGSVDEFATWQYPLSAHQISALWTSAQS